MATYNLAASDLLTLLNSTVTQATARAILESVEGAFGSAFPFSPTGVNTTNGPSSVISANFPVQNSDKVAATSTLNGTTPTSSYAIDLELITVPTSTITGSSSAQSPGTETSQASIALSTLGGIVIGVGDQNVSVTDTNSGTKSDTLIGGAYLERMVSLEGNNLLVAGSGANTLIGGSGADTLLGSGTSRLVAGSGANVLKSSTLSSGADTLIGGSGASTLISQGGNNRLIGGSGANTLQGGAGHDTLISGGKTTFQIGSGATRVVESISGAKDTIFAGSGADSVVISTKLSNVGLSIVGSSNSASTLRVVDLSGSNTITGGAGSESILLSNVVGGATLTNTANQTINAGSGSIRLVTNEAYANYSLSTSGSVNTVTFKGTGQTLTINDATGNSVTLVFGSGHAGVKI